MFWRKNKKKIKNTKMTEDKLQKANDLKTKIDRIKKQLDLWKQAKGMRDSINLCGTNGHILDVFSYNIDFEVMKTLAISKIEKDLKAVIDEFNNL